MKNRSCFVLFALFVSVAGGVSASLTDAEWARVKADYLSRPRRVLLDDDATVAHNFDMRKPVTFDNVCAYQMANMVGKEFDALVFCGGSAGLSVVNATKTGLRRTQRVPMTFAVEKELGRDLLQIAHDFARSNGFEFVINMRANDIHDCWLEWLMTDFKKSHPELMVGGPERSKRAPFANWSAWDFAEPKVREIFRAIVLEWFENYDPDGFMIDFYREPCVFKSVAMGGRAAQAEMDAYTEMLRELREAAERIGRRRGRPIYFAFRLPDTVEVARGIGLDVERWMSERLFDLYIAGADFGRYGTLAGAAGLCRKHGVRFYPSVDSTFLKASPSVFNRNSREAFNGRFASAYAAGADGVYLFNMMYCPWYFPSVRRKAEDLATVDKAYFVTPYECTLTSAYQPLPGEGDSVPVLCSTYPLMLADDDEHSFLIETGDDFSMLDPTAKPTVTLAIKGTMDARRRVRVKLNGCGLKIVSHRQSVARYEVPPSVFKCGVNVLTLSRSSEDETVEQTVLSGKELLSGANQAPWRRLCGADASLESIVGGTYRIANGTNGLSNLVRPIGNFSGGPVAAKFRLTVEPGSQSGSVSFRLANGRSVEVVDFVPEGISLRYAGRECRFDTTASHEYALKIADGKAVLTADGRELLAGTVGANVGRAECQIRGNGYRIMGLNEASLLVGATRPVVGAARWSDVRLVATPLKVEDAVLRVEFAK